MREDQYVAIGNRVPKDFFETKGKGVSDNTIHAGSYHLAMIDAGIDMCNIMTYSSILPAIANKINRPTNLVHGSVMESILAVAHGVKREYISAGLIYAWLHSWKTGEKYGGLVCEINGSYLKDNLLKKLKYALLELYENGYSKDFSLTEPHILHNDLSIKEHNYGSVLVGLCFTSYNVPLISVSRCAGCLNVLPGQI